jgi:hypothetical protein
MTKASTIITAAFREGNLVPVGGAPSDAEATEGLDLLNRLVLSAYGFSIGNKLMDWQVPAIQRTSDVSRQYPLLPGGQLPFIPYNVNPPLNSRVVWDGSVQTIYLNDLPQDGANMAIVKGSGADGAVPGALTIDGNGRTINGASTIVSGDAGVTFPLQLFYRADVSDWRTVKAIVSTDDMLFPPELDDLWICALSIRLAPRYGKAVAAGTTARFGEMRSIFAARYQQTAPTASGGDDLFNTFQSFPSVGPGLRWMQ